MRLGPYVDGVKVSHDVNFSNIHVLVQVKPRIFLHEVFSDTGTIKQFIVYRATFENVPIMTRDLNSELFASMAVKNLSRVRTTYEMGIP